MVPGGLPHPRASTQGQARRVALRHGQWRGARVDGPGAAVGWRPTRHPWGGLWDSVCGRGFMDREA